MPGAPILKVRNLLHFLLRPLTHSALDSRKRDQSFISGFARQLFQYRELPQELAVWMIEQCKKRYLRSPEVYLRGYSDTKTPRYAQCRVPSNSKCKYIVTLKIHAQTIFNIRQIHPQYYSTILTSSGLIDIFRSLGAKASSLDPSRQIIHSDHLPNSMCDHSIPAILS